ncbi:Mannosyltransferase OCH1 and related enzymes [Moraxella caprae]|uniref:Mannosyltransferase OCH1 and related enzymes n=1 Tax=Moraxella caprae TaxID=90240 RepID=A0A378R0V3_9GAMM|nr:capsular polysaccharide synthesis protein [Moraxella caprae]STZ08825.1 Mannosyltransferase OCH1 and related enzymes [Moraxella caprae]
MDMTLQELIHQIDTPTPKTAKLKKWEQKTYKAFYRTFIPKSIRKQHKKNASSEQQKHLACCFFKLIQYYQSGKLISFDIQPKKPLPHQKIIWQYWGQGIDGNLPEIVKLCFDSIDKYKGDYTVIRLDDNNIHEYLDLPNFVWQKRQNPEFKHAFFADLIRLALLYAYGGIWIDATILLTNEIDDNIKQQDFFMFQRDQNALNKEFWQNFNADYFCWSDKHFVNVLNSFIVAKKNHSLIHVCLDLLLNFWQTQNHITHYFFFQILFDVLVKGEHSSLNCQIIDDTLPHLLIANINKPFDENFYQDILDKNHIHKLTYISTSNPYIDRIKNSML